MAQILASKKVACSGLDCCICLCKYPSFIAVGSVEYGSFAHGRYIIFWSIATADKCRKVMYRNNIFFMFIFM